MAHDPAPEVPGPRLEQVVRPVPADLRPALRSVVGYRYSGFPPGRHLGLPSPDLTVVVSLGEPVHLTEVPDADQPPGAWPSLVSGLATRRAVIAHDGDQYGLQLALTPLGARSLLGLPAGEIGAATLTLPTVLGRSGHELGERLAHAPDWERRFDELEGVLRRRLGMLPPPRAELEHAWHRLVAGAPVASVAAEVGWSRRHLGARFRREYGLTPSEAVRVARFDRARRLLGSPGAQLADVAARAGFYDQSHLTREWHALAGCTPTAWLADEVFPSVQDTTGVAA